MSNWTDNQKLAIYEEGSNIIVSAGAGSGKTTVLTARVIEKLKKGVNIDHLLVLTFTNAAAAEMKDRIREAIKKEGMTEQLNYIDASYITTFDSYAGSLVRKYHYLLNISPTIKVIDDTIINIKKNAIIDDIFENSYGNKDFDNFISKFCEKDDREMKKMILSINEKLDLKSDKEYYIDNYIDTYFSDTFINKAIKDYENLVIEKLNRLKELLYEIEISFDSKFYNSLLDIFNPLISSSSYEEIRKNLNIDKLPSKPKGTDEELTSLYDSFKEVKDELIDLCYYSIDELKDNLKETKDTSKVIMEIIKELNIRLDKYKDENESYTFTDIAKMAIKIVKENEEVKDELKNFYNEIMVDEYQDTSDLQEEFISLIANNNVYMVGDVKQSIYRFRHANPLIFKNKYNDYSKNINGIKIDLLENFRSREEVLKNINEIFDLIMDDNIGNAEYRKTHRMKYGNKMYDLKENQVKYDMDILTYDEKEDKTYTKEEIEAFIIARDIEEKVNNEYQVIDKETKKLRPINYSDFCIIMDRKSAFATYSKIFEYLSIPIVIWQDEKLNEEVDILLVKNIIRLILKIKENNLDQEFRYYFTSIARSYLFSYDDSKIFNIFKNNQFKEDDIYKIAYDISLMLDSLTNESLLDVIIDKFNLYEKCILKGDIESSMVRYGILKDLFISLSSLGYTPYDLPLYFENIKNTDITYSLNTKVSNSVNLMNIHKSKGLEFNICYFSGLYKTFNDSDIKDSFVFDDTYGLIVPFYKEGKGSTILKELYKNRYIKEDISERIRLFYVALTRAKEKIIIVTPIKENKEIIKDIVPNDVRLKYKSLSSIINSISLNLNKYVTNILISSLDMTKNYDFSKKKKEKDAIVDKKIEHINLDLSSEFIEESHFSKVTNYLHTKEEIDNMEYGTYMHYLLEVTDFNNPKTDNKKVINFINKLNLEGAKIYKEYEFIYEEDSEIKHGIIDLMLEYDDHIDIIDYKLKQTLDENYYKQVNGYKKYIEEITNKKVNPYLYSITLEKFTEVK